MQLPPDFTEKMKLFLEQEWEDFLFSYEHERYQALRFNPLKPGFSDRRLEELFRTVKRMTAEEDFVTLPEENTDLVPVPWAKWGFYYDADMHPGKHPFHEMGVYYIQEPSAMSAAALLAPTPGMRVLDLCAAPGGKSTQLASYLGQKGLLVANEIHPARAKILSGNIERLGIKNAVVTNEDSAKLAAHFPSFFHAILVDAPCSGEGMFRKNPEAMEEWSKEQVAVCAARQREILDNAASMLLPGGRLVYSTCTFSAEENEENIQSFLEAHEEFSFEEADAPWFDKVMDGAYRLWPHKLHGEGHFVAVLKKRGVLPAQEAALSVDKHGKFSGGKKQGGVLSKEQKNLLQDFLETTLTAKAIEQMDEERMVLFGEQLYMLPEASFSLGGLRILRAGLHIGEFKKNRFEPSHALALALGKEDVTQSVDLAADDRMVEAYLKGESLFLEEAQRKGWLLICVDGFSAGWAKAANGQLKNHYPKGLRK